MEKPVNGREALEQRKLDKLEKSARETIDRDATRLTDRQKLVKGLGEIPGGGSAPRNND